jgi:hypothetical protein
MSTPRLNITSPAATASNLASSGPVTQDAFSHQSESGSISWSQLITSYPARLGLYGLIVMVAFQILYAFLQERGASWLAEENGPIELAQVACLLFAVAGLAIAARWTPIGRAALVGTAALLVYAAARESDDWIQAMFFEDAYRTLVGLPAAACALLVAYSERDKLLRETMLIAHKPGATLFAIGGIYLCVFCQMLDRPKFWEESGLLGSDGYRKSMVEESAELFAYLLIAFSALEAMISAWQDRAALQHDVSGATDIAKKMPATIRAAA